MFNPAFAKAQLAFILSQKPMSKLVYGCGAAGLKEKGRAKSKAVEKGRADKVIDILAATIEFDTEAELLKAAKMVSVEPRVMNFYDR